MATSWVAEQGGPWISIPPRIAVGGDSAGGNLAAVVSLMARDRSGPGFATRSWSTRLRITVSLRPRTGKSRRLLSDPGQNDVFLEPVPAGRSQRTAPLCLTAPGFRSGLSPPALVITAGFDPLRDEDEDYANRLRAAGIPVNVSRYDGMIHGFFIMGALVEQTRAAREEVAHALRAAFDELLAVSGQLSNRASVARQQSAFSF